MTVKNLIPAGMPERLSISFWIFYYLFRSEKSAYHNLERCFIELKERGFNTVRVDSGAGLIHDAAGNLRGSLKFHSAFPNCRSLRQIANLPEGYCCNVLENIIELFELAQKYDVRIILSSWFYLHTFWYVDRKIRNEFFALPVYERFMRFARDLSLILDELKKRGLAQQVAFAEIFNEFEVMPAKWRMFPTDADASTQLHVMHSARRWHEEALDFLRSRHPDILFAIDTSAAEILRPEILPRNAQVWNRHCYFAWPVYGRVFERAVFDPDFDFASAGKDEMLAPFLKSTLTPIEKIREACGFDEEYEPGWYARVWLYQNMRDDMLPELERRLTESFHQDAPEYRRALERCILNSGDMHDWLLPQTLMVVGEGMTYCPLPEMRWEEKSSDYWELVKLNANLLAKQGCWGAMLRTNSGPEDPVWQEYPEKLHQANTAFLHG